MDVQLIVVPYELGSERVGEGLGPDRLMEHDLARSLSAAGAYVRVERVQLANDRPRGSETLRTFEVARLLSDRIAEAVRSHRFPLVLGGSCMTSLGVVAGLRRCLPERSRIGIAWLDAHGDFNTPDTTPSGYLDGMPLAVIAGRCWKNLSAQVPGFRPMPDDAIALLGVRDVDPLEAALLRDSKVVIAWAREIRTLPGAVPAMSRFLAERLRDLRSTTDLLHLHVDLDVLDPVAAPANRYPAIDGLSTDAVDGVIRHLAENFRVVSATVAAYDPSCDPDGRVPPIARGLIARIVGSASIPLEEREITAPESERDRGHESSASRRAPDGPGSPETERRDRS